MDGVWFCFFCFGFGFATRWENLFGYNSMSYVTKRLKVRQVVTGFVTTAGNGLRSARFSIHGPKKHHVHTFIFLNVQKGLGLTRAGFEPAPEDCGFRDDTP